MDTIVSESTLVNPTTSLKNLDVSKPTVVEMISEESFKKFIPSGIKVRVNIPVFRATNRAMFAINVDGFIPQFNLGEDSVVQFYRNFFPVQVFENSIGNVEIYQEQVNVPIQTQYIAHRFFAGHVNVGIRVTSNTSQTGTFMITQASTCLRNYYHNTENYRGLRFLNTSIEGSDYAVDSFILGDLSINRNWGITTVGKGVLPKIDLAQKLWYMHSSYNTSPSQTALLNHMPYVEQFAEDWLFFTPITNIPNQNGGQVDFEIFFDYSNVEFYVPMLPILALPNVNTDQQVLNFSSTFKDKAGTIGRSDFVYGFSPPPTQLINFTDEEEEISSKDQP